MIVIMESKEKQKFYNLINSFEKKGVKIYKEVKFDSKRRWRFDVVLEYNTIRIAIEYEGVFVKKGEQSRHTNPVSYTGDTEKYNQAVVQGWKVLRYTAINYKHLEKDVKTIFNIK